MIESDHQVIESDNQVIESDYQVIEINQFWQIANWSQTNCVKMYKDN